ncbi:MAG: TolC family protein, partial [Bdellovibrionaceae bacterium]|nr:TolC family protein [Pseudobdellovibrionaceae bacterium]
DDLNASQLWINPELQAEKTVKDADTSETTAALMFTVRLGGKKQALVQQYQGVYQKEKHQNQMSVQVARLEHMKSLYRLTQIRREIAIEEETVRTYTKVINQYQRPKLSPENEVTLSLFNMAISDHQIKLVTLKSSEDMFFDQLSAATGLTKNEIVNYLPAQKKDWPTYNPAPDKNETLDIKIAESELKIAESQLEQVKGMAWPDLRIGPALKQVLANNQTETFTGVSLSMPLPLFSFTENQKSAEIHRVTAAKLDYENTQIQSKINRAALVRRYNLLVENLKSTLSNKVVDNNHQKLERQFFKGLISGVLVIEAHRQFIEFEKRRNQAELEAIESIGRLYILDETFEGMIL